MARHSFCSFASILLLAGSVYADTLSGSIKFKDGSTDKGTTRISSSWNSKTGKSDGKGNYTLDFGGKVGKKVTIFVNGKKYTEVEVKGDARLNIIVP